jgi:multiple sugar transport system permease protein
MFNLPAYSLLFGFTLLPLILSFYVSLQKYELMNPPFTFIGLANYRHLLGSDVFWGSLCRTFIFTFSSIFIISLSSIGLALLLNIPVQFIRGLRPLLVIPWAIPALVVGIIWAWIFDAQFGLANYLIGLIGIKPLFWLSSPNLAMITIIIAKSWHELTFGTLILLAGLQAIPTSIYDAAELEGAGTIDRFFFITLPLIRNHISVLLIFETIWCLREFAIIYAMTYGGPGKSTTVLGWLVYKFAFLNYDFGKSAAVGISLGIITMLISFGLIRLIYRRFEF